MNDEFDVRDRLVRMEAKLDLIGVQHAATERIAGDHETRIRSLEQWRYAIPVTGVAAIITGAVSIIIAIKGG